MWSGVPACDYNLFTKVGSALCWGSSRSMCIDEGWFLSRELKSAHEKYVIWSSAVLKGAICGPPFENSSVSSFGGTAVYPICSLVCS